MKNLNENSNYTIFIAMLITSGIAMYITMYLNTYEWNHVYFSWTRMYMTLMGLSTMAVIMFLFMKGMYNNKAKNIGIILGSAVIFLTSLFLVRQQKPIEDIKWMKAMIPHHSIAVLTSGRANIKDPEVKKLAEDIIKAQEREIAEMKAMIRRLEKAK